MDIVTQILNFGLSAPIDIQIVGPDLYANRALAERMLERGPLCSRRRRRAHPAALQLSQHDGERRPHPRPGHRPDAAECGAKPAGGSERQLPDHPQLLPRSQNRRHLQRGRQGPAIRARLAGRARRACPSPARAPRNRPPATSSNPALSATAVSRSSRAPGQCAGQPGLDRAGRRAGHGQPLRRAAGDRHLRQCGWNRPGHGDPRDGKDHRAHTRKICRAARTSSCAARARP